MSNQPHATNQTLQNYINSPFGLLTMKGVRIGRVVIEEVAIAGREAAINLQEIFLMACDKTKRLRISKNGTRYPEPLPVASPARLLSIEMQDHLNDMARRNLQPRTIEATERTLKLLRLTCGDIPVSRIDHKHIYQLWDVIRWAPTGLMSFPNLDALTPDRSIAIGKKETVPAPAPATMERHRRFLVAFFNQLVRTRAIPASPMAPFAEVKKDLAIDPNKPERLFDDEDLKRIFAPSTFIPWAKSHPHRWWAPMIGLHTGARINEVAQLKLADIVQESGMWCIRIQKTIDADLAHKATGRSRQSLKGKAAVRTLPIPKPLLDAGFIDFVEDMRACGHPRLFPHLSAGVNRKTGETNARYSQGILNQFGRYLRDLGFPKGVGFHAFRHTFATELHHQGIPEEDIALVTGHSVSKKVPVLHEAYFHKKPAVARAKQVKALASYQPPVELPIYARGQFEKQLQDQSKFYP
ncbi:site-specific integrase [Stenotrophomonas acidaminiphila]|uniref:site-specific integrase n=1 Tax=Stenotrophomonas acidaminiphila TaxID=128780 RepID=UPI00289B67A3|nr:site-specific integrase [Stenotrophomonas acidaminiphila]